MSPYTEIGLSNNVDPPLILGTFWKNTRGDSFVAPIPKILRGLGIHYSGHKPDSEHETNHLHIKSNRKELRIHEDIDLQSFSKKIKTIDKSMMRPPAEGQPASIFIFNRANCLNRIATFSSRRKRGKNIQRMLLGTNMLSQSTIQVEVSNLKMIPETMNMLRFYRHAGPGDLAMIYAHQTNEMSLYAYPHFISRSTNDGPFMTIKIDDLEQPSIDSIKRILPFVEPLIDPTMRALLKASSYISPSSYNSSYLSLNPSCRFTL